MPEHLRALVVILALATFVFLFAKAPACAVAMPSADFERRRNLWLAITLTAFLAHNFWVYLFATAASLLFTLSREQNRLALFFFLLFAVPGLQREIPGIGGIRYFFDIDYTRLLVLAVLLPTYLSLRTRSGIERFGTTLPDKLIAGYIVLNFLLMLTVSTFTGALRHGVFYAFIDILLPYYVASRSLRDLAAFRDALMAFAIAALLLSAAAVFEAVRHWLLYAPLQDALGARWGMGNYLERGYQGALRAQGSTGHPIALGYVTAVAAAFFLYLRRSIPNRTVWNLGLLLLTAGLVASLSRGPWVGAAVMLCVFIAAGPAPATQFIKLVMLGTAVLAASLIFPIGANVLDYLPFVGSIEEGSVSYRRRLLEISIDVILGNPFFGGFNYIYSPAMQELKQGEGIIDIVNTYLGVGLTSGLVGLSLFAGFFFVIVINIIKTMARLPDRNDDLYLLGRVLCSALIGILVTIFTVSSISVIPVVYWSVAGLGLAYMRILVAAKDPEVAQRSGFHPARSWSG